MININKYKDFDYVIIDNDFNGFYSYIDITEYMFLNDEMYFDNLPFHRGCTFSGTLPQFGNKWFIGCTWTLDEVNDYSVVENSIKNVIDHIFYMIVKHDLEVPSVC